MGLAGGQKCVIMRSSWRKILNRITSKRSKLLYLGASLDNLSPCVFSFIYARRATWLITSFKSKILADDTIEPLWVSCGRNWQWSRKKIILKSTSNNCTQEFIVNTLNVSQCCIYKFLKRWKYRQNVENLHRTSRPRKSDDKFSVWQIHRNANDVLPY